MRKNYRNSIASIKKFPQFTTMNVIDGQAGLIICASLIFYSLTIDNILNIVAEFTVTSIQLYYTRRDFEVKKLIQLSRNYLTAGLIMFGFCWILRNTINKNIISFILQVIVGGVVYTTMLVLLKDKFFEKIINKIFKILSNQKRNDII